MSLKIDMRGKAERLYIRDKNFNLHKASFRVREVMHTREHEIVGKSNYLYIRWREGRKTKERFIGKIS